MLERVREDEFKVAHFVAPIKRRSQILSLDHEIIDPDFDAVVRQRVQGRRGGNQADARETTASDLFFDQNG
jgi:hypothetical protein